MIEHVLRYVIPAAYSLLPAPLPSDKATAMILAAGMQESKFLHRVQQPRVKDGKPGPAKSFWQYESGKTSALAGLLTLTETRAMLDSALRDLRLPPTMNQTPTTLQALAEVNDTVACVCARLLLWTLPQALPGQEDAAEGWRQYLAAWRPGAPHPETWETYYAKAWALTLEGRPKTRK